MNAERLHAIILAIKDDLQKTALVNTLKELTTHLQNQVNQPNQPQHQQQVSTILANLFQNLEKAPSNDFPPTWRLATEEIECEELLGNNLRAKIDEIFSRNQITPSVALDEIKEIHSSVSSLNIAIDQLISGFKHLNIGADDLEPGECEIGVLVPRDFVKNLLNDFGKELIELNKIFNVFAEISTGSRAGFEIREISSSELSVFLDLAPAIGACLAISVERIVALYKQLLEIRKLHNDLKEQGVPKKSLKGVGEHANTIMEKGIEELIPQLIDQFCKKDDKGRKNELSNELRLALKKIANRIDRGFNIEIRVEPIQEEAEEVTGSQETESYEYIQAILSSAKELQFIKESGGPILSLPESDKSKERKK